MPRHLFVAVLSYIASRGAMAALAPLHETGIARLTSPILMLLFLTVSVLFMRRVAWTWRFMQAVAFTEISINTLFFPSPEFHGSYTGIARLLITMVIASSCVILWSLTSAPATKRWFST
jgi:hypothetical protein